MGYDVRMRTPILIVLAALTAIAPPPADAAPVVGQSVLYRYDSTHIYPAVVTADLGSGSATLVVLDTDGFATDFPTGASSQLSYATITLVGVIEDATGAMNHSWRVNPSIGLGEQGPQGPAGPTGPQGAQGPAGPGSLVTSTSIPTLALNGPAVQLSATNDTEYTATVRIANTLTLTGGSAGHVDLVCDASSSPTTVVETVGAENTGTLTIGLALTQSSTAVLRWRSPAGHYCRLTTTNDTGTPIYTLVRQYLQTLG